MLRKSTSASIQSYFWFIDLTDFCNFGKKLFPGKIFDLRSNGFFNNDLLNAAGNIFMECSLLYFLRQRTRDKHYIWFFVASIPIAFLLGLGCMNEWYPIFLISNLLEGGGGLSKLDKHFLFGSSSNFTLTVIPTGSALADFGPFCGLFWKNYTNKVFFFSKKSVFC